MRKNILNQDNIKARYPDFNAPNTDEAVDFLCRMSNHGHVVVAPISLDNQTRPTTFDVDAEEGREALRSFLRYNEKLPYNVYFHPNTVNFPVGRHPMPKRENVVEITDVVLDFDPVKGRDLDEERDRIRVIVDKLVRGQVPPFVVITTGGGAQVIYKLAQPIAITPGNRDRVIGEIEALYKALARSLGADTTTFAVKHLFRVPGTTNWPTPAKAKAGREVSYSGIWFTGGPRVTLKDLQSLCVMRPAEVDESIATDELSLDEHALVEVLEKPEQLPAPLRQRIADDHRLATIIGMRDIDRPDNSTKDFNFVNNLAHYRVPAGDMALIMSAYGFKMRTVHEQGRLAQFIGNEVARALAREAKAFALLGDEGFMEPSEDKVHAAQARAMEQARFDRLRPLAVAEALARLGDGSQARLVRGLLARQQMTVVYGRSGSGKTFVVLDMAYKISLGLDWNGRRTTPCDVVYIAAEAPHSILYRLKALVEEYGESRHFFMVGAQVDMFDSNVDLKPLRDQIDALHVDVGLIVVDTLARTMSGGDENSTKDMGRLIANGDVLRDRFRANVCWVHHTGKDESRGARGSSALRAATDTEIEIRDSRYFEVTKLRDGDTFSCEFELRDNVLVHTTPEGEAITTCLVSWRGETIRPGSHRTPRESNRDIVLKILRRLQRPATINEIIDEARLDGIKMLPRNTVKSMLERSCDSETERLFKRCGVVPTGVQKNFAVLYGLWSE